MAMYAKVETFKLGDWELQSGQSIPNAEIAYKAFGDPRSPAIIYPSWYSGGMLINFQHIRNEGWEETAAIEDNEWLVGTDQVLSPADYYIVITALFGNGQSTSPSNSDIKPFPKVTFYDNVRAQYKLVTEHLGIKHARAVLGWSMGAGQTYQVSLFFSY